jgi:hypothetical protein
VGWDCTLHVVDRASLARFSARFLRGMYRDAAFDREYDADEMIRHVKQLIATDPATGARALGELALLYVSTETPHAYCRGFALSLWDDAAMQAELPTKWLGSVESYLVDITAAYPRIAGRIPRAFDRNGCVGPLVTARDVRWTRCRRAIACATARCGRCCASPRRAVSATGRAPTST